MFLLFSGYSDCELRGVESYDDEFETVDGAIAHLDTFSKSTRPDWFQVVDKETMSEVVIDPNLKEKLTS